MSSIEEIKARIDIVDLVSESVQLRRSGKNYTGLCPFHHNVNTPSFVVFPHSDSWHCFGECNEGGDIFKFVMKKENWEFVEALEYLAERAGVELKPLSPQQEAEQEEHEGLRALLEDAVVFYRHQLLNTPGGKVALDYLRGRNLSDETIEVFELGYSPDSWDAIMKYLASKGHTPEQMAEAGMVSERDNGGYYDRFRHRMMIPIRDERGRMVGFGARVLPKPGDDSKPHAKYLNSPQTPLFDKSSLLFGLHKARSPIRSADQAVIVEGYMGVIALHQAGYTNAVAQMGTALTDQQLRILKRLTRNIILALDSDAAGMNATMRGLQVARETLDRSDDPIFDARGLLRHEARLQADIRVTTLPPGQDPDDVVNADPQQWETLIGAARPIVEHVMDTLAADRDLDNPKEKTEIAKQVLPLIRDLPEAIERDHYLQRLARVLKVDERALLDAPRPATPGRRPRTQAPRHPTAPARKASAQSHLVLGVNTHNLEAYCLGIIMRHPELLYKVNRALQEAGLERLSSNDFQHTDHQVMYRVSMDALEQEHSEPISYALSALPQPLIDLADEILTKTNELDPNEERVLEDLLRAILRIREERLNQMNDQLRQLMQEAQEEGTLIPTQYAQTRARNARVELHLDKAIARYSDRSISTAK